MDISQTQSITNQVDFLRVHAHCIGIKTSTTTIDEYYIYDHFGYDWRTDGFRVGSHGFVVHYEYDKRNGFVPVSISKHKPEDIELMVDAMGLRYGV